MSHPLPKRLAAEAVGTALLLAAVVGPGITGERLANSHAANRSARPMRLLLAGPGRAHF